MSDSSYFMNVVNGRKELSQVSRLLRWEFVRFDEKVRTAYVKYHAEKSLTNPLGYIQGGIISAMLDDAMGPAIYINLPNDKLAVTIESKTNFIEPVMPGTIWGEGIVEFSKGSIVFTSGKLFDSNKNVLATGSATFKLSRFNDENHPWSE